MCSKGNDEGIVSVANIVKNSSTEVGNIEKTHFLSKSYHQSLFYVNDVSSEVINFFGKVFVFANLFSEKSCIIEEDESRSVFESYGSKGTGLPDDNVIKIPRLKIELGLESIGSIMDGK